MRQQKDDRCQPDYFAAQKPLIQEIIENRGHKELNLLRAILGCSKTVYLNNCDFTFKGLEKTIF